jgi:hypothetical protein
MKKQDWVDARLTKSLVGDDHPYPFSPAMLVVGYGLFERLPGHAELPALWPLATSDEPAKRHEFVRVIDLFAGTDPLAPTVIDLAFSILSGSEKPVNSVKVLEVGRKNGEKNYSIVSGERHVVAVMWLWCIGLFARPLVQTQILQQV